MKKTAIAALMIATAVVSSFAQGNVNFNNRVTGTTSVVAPIYGVGPSDSLTAKRGNATTNGGTVDYTGHALLAGTGFSAELLGGDPGNLVSLSTVQFRTTASLAGFVTPPALAVIVAGRPGGTPTTFQVRAWNNGGNILSTYADALMNERAAGASDTFVVTLGTPPGTPPILAGLTSFNLTVVPEPGVIALGVLGLGALLLRRRK
jgi:hypothetical protein